MQIPPPFRYRNPIELPTDQTFQEFAADSFKLVNSCWVLTKVHCTGYGMLKLNGFRFRASYLAWSFDRRMWLPPRLCVCHVCDNRSCVNPGHLFAGTDLDNVRDLAWKKSHRKPQALEVYRTIEHRCVPDLSTEVIRINFDAKLFVCNYRSKADVHTKPTKTALVNSLTGCDSTHKARLRQEQIARGVLNTQL